MYENHLCTDGLLSLFAWRTRNPKRGGEPSIKSRQGRIRYQFAGTPAVPATPPHFTISRQQPSTMAPTSRAMTSRRRRIRGIYHFCYPFSMLIQWKTFGAKQKGPKCFFALKNFMFYVIFYTNTALVGQRCFFALKEFHV